MELSSFSSTYKAFVEEHNINQANQFCVKACTSALKNPTATYLFFLRYSRLKSMSTALITRLSATIALNEKLFCDSGVLVK